MMTNEEAIRIATGLRTDFKCESDTMVDFCNTIIKALEQQSCGDAISKQAVDTLVDELARAISDERCCISRGRSTATIMQDILDLPPVTPEPKMGHWEWVQYDYNPKLGNWHCSECHCIVIEGVYKNEKAGIPLYKYCPQCGVKIGVIEE